MEKLIEQIDRDQYIAGFLDGDGCVQLQYPFLGHPTPVPWVSVTQSFNEGHPPELLYIQKHYGGYITVHSNAEGNRRTCWRLYIQGLAEVVPILTVIAWFGIVKRATAIRALQYIQNGRIDALDAAIALAALHTSYQDIAIDSSRLTASYVAGLFAAEGWVGMSFKGKQEYYELKSSIAQDGCIRLLQAIQQKLGLGRVSAGQLRFSTAQTIRFLQWIRPHLNECQKLPQVDLVLIYHNSKTSKSGRTRTQTEKEHMQKTANELKRYKRM